MAVSKVEQGFTLSNWLASSDGQLTASSCPQYRSRISLPAHCPPERAASWAGSSGRSWARSSCSRRVILPCPPRLASSPATWEPAACPLRLATSPASLLFLLRAQQLAQRLEAARAHPGGAAPPPHH